MARLQHRVFTATGIYTALTAGTKKFIIVTGGGNGGNGSTEGSTNRTGGGGASGNVSVIFVDMAVNETISVTVNSSTAAAAAGGSVSIGTLFTLPGGQGGSSAVGNVQGIGGISSHGRGWRVAGTSSSSTAHADTYSVPLESAATLSPYLTPAGSIIYAGGNGANGGDSSTNGGIPGGGGGGWKTMYTGNAVYGQGGNGGSSSANTGRTNGTNGIVIVEG